MALSGVGLLATIKNRGSDPAPEEKKIPTINAKIIDGYIADATVFVDSDKDGQQDPNEFSTTSDAQGNFTLPQGLSGPVVAVGGRDISTNLNFIGVLKAPAGSTVVTPLTTLVTELMATNANLSASAAQDQVLDAVGLSDLKGKVDLTTLDPVAGAAANTANALDVLKAGVAVATLVSSLSVKVQETAGVGADKHDEIAGGIFSQLATTLSADKLSTSQIAATGSTVINTIAAQATVGGVSVTNGAKLKTDSVSALENLAELASKISSATSVDTVVSGQKTALTNTTYTLQLLHFADAEAGLLASQTAPRLAALVDAFEDDFANSITLAGGDNFIPGPFMAAGTDPSLLDVLGVPGNRGNIEIGALDLAIHNKIGVVASTLGNHEFDLGSNALAGAFRPSSGSPGADFVYLSANLDFSADSALKSHFVDTQATAGLEEASSLKGKIAPSAIITEGGAKIGLVGATTQLLESISSPSGTKVKDNDSVRSDDMDLLAAQLQPVINDLIAQGVNKIILMAHLQVLANEKLLASKLSGVDIILAAGSNTRLGDVNDTAVAFAGHAATFADTYPLLIKDKDGRDTLVVNTDNEFTYLGRLVVDFDANGHIVVDSLDGTINGAYAATDANVAKAWDVSEADLATTAFAQGTRGGEVKALTDAVQSVITAKDGNVYGFSDVYLEGERTAVRNQETNLGNLSADANGYALQQALGDAAAQTYVVSLKNGGGIRAQIGTLSAPKADGSVDKLPPEGGVSQLDVENSLRFNNQLMAFDTTPAGLKAILEHGVASLGSQGRFPQLGGVSFSYDPDLPSGSRVGDIALVSEGYRVNLYDNGTLLAGAPAHITVVTLNFLANGGDSYPIKANGENFRYVVEQTGGGFALTAPVDEAKNFTAADTITAAVGSNTLLGEQAAFEAYMQAFHATEQTAYDQADTPAELDTRIQNLNVRSEDVLGSATAGAQLLNASIDGLGDAITLHFDRALDGVNLPAASQFSVLASTSTIDLAVSSVQVYDNQVRLRLASALEADASAEIAFRDPTTGDDTATLQARDGADVMDFRGVAITNRLSQQASGTENFAQAATTTGLAGAEISAFDPGSKRLFVTSSAGLQVLSVDAELNMTLLGTVSLGSNDINSVATKNGIVAVAVAASDKTQPGAVYFLDADASLSVTDGAIATQGFVLNNVTVGALPDMVTFTADGTKVLVANEAEQNDVDGSNPPALVNPEGSVSIIDLSSGAASATATTASFAAFNNKAAELGAKGVRLFAGQAGFENITVAQDLEPEYIAIAPDGKTAFVTLQENNALAILDIASGQFTDIVPLGRKSFLGLPFDGSDRDGASNANAVALSTERPVFGQYMPDAIAAYLGADGKAYYLIANEGDDRDDFIAPNETTSVSSLNLDAVAFPNAADLKTNAQIGRLTVSNAPGNNGDVDGDGDTDQLLAYGARSFSIVDAQGRMVFDSGSHIEQFVAANGTFDSKNPSTSGLFDDTRSDNKGPEPEGITVGQVGGKTLAFVGLERGGGGVMVYDVTNPAQVSFVQYLRNPADVSPEGLTFVAAKDSPSGQDALFVTNEVTNSVTAFENTTLITAISAVQGSGTTAAKLGEAVTIEGIVTAWMPGLSGFFVQEEAADSDSNAATSEGLFVYYGNTNPGVSDATVGDTVRVSGTVSEYQKQSQLSSLTAFSVITDRGDASALPAPVQVTLPVAESFDWESVEGMRVEVRSGTTDGELVVTDTYVLGRYGSVTLTSDELLVQYTQTNAPSASGYAAYSAATRRDQIVLDDGTSAQNPATVFGRGGQPLSATNPLRAGDATSSIVGVVDQFDNNTALPYETTYRVQATTAPLFSGPTRPTAEQLQAELGAAEVKVASVNVLNFFTTFGNASFTTPNGTDLAGRGADGAAEYQRQLDKLLVNLTGLDADVYGLMEIQNNGYADGTSALDALVDALNAKVGSAKFAYVAGPFDDGVTKQGDAATAGDDAIMVALVYDQTAVAPVGRAAVPDVTTYDAFGATYGNRVPVAQTFQSLADGQTFTVAVNHLKSKGSVLDADTGDGQGANNLARMEGVKDLSDWLATNPTGAPDGDILLIGDLNAYAEEDPITFLEGAGYSMVSDGLSYSFDGLWGSLDHALANASMASQVTKSVVWAVNAEEPVVLDYNTNFKSVEQQGSFYAPDAYRSSDHNPLLIGLNLSGGVVDTTAPVLQSARVDGNTLTLSYAENLQSGALPTANAFTLTVNGQAGPAVTQVAVRGQTATLTLATAVLEGQTVTLAYGDPTDGNDANALQDVVGNDAASLAGQAVVNATQTPDTTAPQLVSSTPAAAATGVAPTANLVLNFDEPVVKGSGAITVRHQVNGLVLETIDVGSSQVTVNGNQVTIDPSKTLALGQGYALEVAAGAFEDAKGNDHAGLVGAGTLKFTVTAGTPVFVSEIHYDNTGTDTGEGVSIFGPAGTNLTGWSVVPYNGLNGQSYTPVANLSGSIDDENNSGFGELTFAISGLQNGAPDGVALVNESGQVVQFLSYEGSFAATNGPAQGKTSTDIGASQSGTEAVGLTLQVVGTGALYEQLSWAAPATGSMGSINVGHTVPAAPSGAFGVGDLVFLGANGDATDAFAFAILKDVAAGATIGFTDRNYSASTEFAGITNEAAYLWTADQGYAAGTIVTIQPDVANGSNPVADKGTTKGAGGGISTSSETIYAFLGQIADLVDGSAGEVTVNQMLASINVGGGSAGDIPSSIASTSVSLNADNALYGGGFDFNDLPGFLLAVDNPANWQNSDTLAFALGNNSLFLV